MTEQLDLLSLAPSHLHGPSESREAAAKVNAEDQYHRVLLALYHADKPLTDDDIAARCGLLRTSAGTRRGIARDRGLVEKAGRGLSALGNPAALWTLTAAGIEAAADIARRAA